MCPQFLGFLALLSAHISFLPDFQFSEIVKAQAFLVLRPLQAEFLNYENKKTVFLYSKQTKISGEVIER